MNIEEYPEGKYIKKGWANKVEKRYRHKPYRKVWKAIIKKILSV